jgi:hypothetical protein
MMPPTKTRPILRLPKYDVKQREVAVVVQFEIHGGVAKGFGTVGHSLMRNKLKVGDAVFYGEPSLSYFIEDVDYDAKTADIKTTAGAEAVTHHDVAWSELTLLDESQNAARIVREATESK